MRKRNLAFAESLVVSSFRRRYLRELRGDQERPRYEELAADAVARLSVGGVRQLCEILKTERAELRDLGDNRLADSLTSAIRGLDSRMQILDDLLH